MRNTGILLHVGVYLLPYHDIRNDSILMREEKRQTTISLIFDIFSKRQSFALWIHFFTKGENDGVVRGFIQRSLYR